MKQITIIRTNSEDYSYGNYHTYHEEEVNNLLKGLQTDCNCTILNVTTISNSDNCLITTIYFDEPTK